MHARFLWSRSRLLQPAVLVGASLWADSRRTVVSESEGKNSKDQKDDPKKNNSSSSPEVFDITQKWNEAQNDARDFWKSSIFTKTEEEKKKEEAIEKSQQDKLTFNGKEFPFENAVEKMKDFFGVKDDNANAASSSSTTEKPKDQDSADSFRDMASSFAGLLAGGGSEKTVQRIVKQARESAEEGDIADKKSLEEMMTLLEQYAQDLKKTADKFLGDVDLTKLYPTSLFYYTEYEDSVKNPSWKRRMHRFYPGIDIRQMEELNDFLQLADLSYADTVEEIQRGLEHFKTPYELVMVDTDSDPHRPAHFLAVKRAQTVFSPSLEILWCVRGTKTLEDALTDLLCDFVPYRGGQAHSGVLEGGKHLSQKHKKLLLKLLDSSGKRKIKLTCVGHSLGAGCASIVGMELKEDPRFDVQVIGFGCPALLSKELSEQTQSYITTVVADDDCVPRLSGPSVVNALLNIMEYDYIPRYVFLLMLLVLCCPQQASWIFSHTSNITHPYHAFSQCTSRCEACLSRITTIIPYDCLKIPGGHHYYRCTGSLNGQILGGWHQGTVLQTNGARALPTG